MNARAQIRMLPDGCRLHMHDGPIDVIVQAFGAGDEVERAYRAAASRFVEILDELCRELAFLRRPVCVDGDLPSGAIAQRMLAAVRPYASLTFITPMAAVAGAVAEEILLAMTSAAQLSRAYVNDGGDIALHLGPGESFVAGMVENPDRPATPTNPTSQMRDVRHLRLNLFGTTTIHSGDPIRGIATSGWRGRSFSLGIADAVTVLAETAAMADAAATVVANAVDLPGHPNVVRAPASELAPDSDLGARLVTQTVGELTIREIRQALESGVRMASYLHGLGLIRAAALTLQGEARVVGTEDYSRVDISLQDRSLIHA